MKRTSNSNYSTTTIFVGRIPNDIVQDELHDQFEEFGKILNITVTGKKYAYVDFKYERSALMAIEIMNGKKVFGRRIVVEMKKQIDRRRRHYRDGPRRDRRRDRRRFDSDHDDEDRDGGSRKESRHRSEESKYRRSQSKEMPMSSSSESRGDARDRKRNRRDRSYDRRDRSYERRDRSYERRGDDDRRVVKRRKIYVSHSRGSVSQRSTKLSQENENRSKNWSDRDSRDKRSKNSQGDLSNSERQDQSGKRSKSFSDKKNQRPSNRGTKAFRK